MEIDFLGLNFPKHSTDQHPSRDPFTHTAIGGVETSLSLSTNSTTTTTTSFDSQTLILSFPEKTKSKSSHYNHGRNPSRTEEPNCRQGHVLIRPIFLDDLNNCPTNMRTTVVVSEFPSEAMLISPNVFTVTSHKQLADKVKYGNSGESRISPSGYTPTVAMARRATLARFLEKRLHRLYQTRTSHFMGKPTTELYQF